MAERPTRNHANPLNWIVAALATIYFMVDAFAVAVLRPGSRPVG